MSLGAPFDSGDWILEPQALVSYTNTSLDRFSESGVKRSKRLRYHAMEIDNVDTELAMKFTYPIRDGQRSLFMPSLRLGWAGPGLAWPELTSPWAGLASAGPGVGLGSARRTTKGK